MAEVLEQDEINELLGQIQVDEEVIPDEIPMEENASPPSAEEEPLMVSIFDFQRPQWISQSQMDDILTALGRWTSLVSFELRRLTGKAVSLEMNAVDLLLAGEYLRSLSDEGLRGLAFWGDSANVSPAGQGSYMIKLPHKPFSYLCRSLLGQNDPALSPEEEAFSRGRLSKRLAGYLLENYLFPAWSRAWHFRGYPEPLLRQFGHFQPWDEYTSLVTISLEMAVEGIMGVVDIAFPWQNLVCLEASILGSGKTASCHSRQDWVVDTELVFPLQGSGWTFEDLKKLREGESLFLPIDVTGRRMIRPQKGELYGD